ncbi:hypothetical protein D3C80_2107300 [compost metagenome]
MAEGAHQSAVLALAVPVHAHFEFVMGVQLPTAAETETVAVIVLALAGVEEQGVLALLHFTHQGQLSVTLLPQA